MNQIATQPSTPSSRLDHLPGESFAYLDGVFPGIVTVLLKDLANSGEIKSIEQSLNAGQAAHEDIKIATGRAKSILNLIPAENQERISEGLAQHSLDARRSLCKRWIAAGFEKHGTALIDATCEELSKMPEGALVARYAVLMDPAFGTSQHDLAQTHPIHWLYGDQSKPIYMSAVGHQIKKEYVQLSLDMCGARISNFPTTIAEVDDKGEVVKARSFPEQLILMSRYTAAHWQMIRDRMEPGSEAAFQLGDIAIDMAMAIQGESPLVKDEYLGFWSEYEGGPGQVREGPYLGKIATLIAIGAQFREPERAWELLKGVSCPLALEAEVEASYPLWAAFGVLDSTVSKDGGQFAAEMLARFISEGDLSPDAESHGATLLQHAARRGLTAEIEVLLKSNANPAAVGDGEPASASELARAGGNDAIAQMLDAAAARFAMRNVAGVYGAKR